MAFAGRSSELDSPRAWVVVVGAFLAAFVSFGVTYSFGVFLKPLAAEFHARHVLVTSLFSTVALVTCILSPFTGKLADRYGPRLLMAASVLFMGAGLVLTAKTYDLRILFVTFGIGMGVTIACTYIPAVAAVGKWFKVYRPLALGIAISGIGCGTLVGAPLSAVLIQRYGWRAAFEIFGYASAALLLLCTILIAGPPLASEKKLVSILGAIRTRAFFHLYSSLLLARIAVYVCMVYLPAYASELGIGQVAGAALVGYIGGASILGRVGLDTFTSRFGLLRVYQCAFATQLIGFGLWLLATSYSSLVIFALVMGIGYGGMAAMNSAVTASLFGVEALGELLGILFTGFGISCMLGPPLSAILVEYTHDYRYPIFVSVTAAVLAFILVLPLKKHAARLALSSAAAN